MNEVLNSQTATNFSAFTSAGLCHYLVLALILFLIGTTIVITSKNTIKILVGLEFMLNSVCVNFAAADAYLTTLKSPQGQVLGLITNAIGAIITACGLAIIIVIYFKLKSVNTSAFCTLKSAECPDSKGSIAKNTLTEEEI